MSIPVAIDHGLLRTFRGAKLNHWSKAARNAMRGGDWSEAFAVSSDTLAVSVGDVCGHGPAVYEYMVSVREAIRARAYRTRDLFEIAAIANEVASRQNVPIPVSALIGFLDASSRLLTVINAGHPRPLMQTANGSVPIGKLPGSPPLGIGADVPDALQSIAVPAGALLVFYTDGIVEREHDVIKGERDLILAAAHIYWYPYLNAANAIAHQLTDGDFDLEDDAAVLTVRTT